MSSITGYNIYRGTSSGGESLLTTVAPGTNSYNDTAVSNGASYYYEVAAVNSVGTGALLDRGTGNAGARRTPAPTLSGTAGNATVGLSWTDRPERRRAPRSPATPYPRDVRGWRVAAHDRRARHELLHDTSVTNGTSYDHEVAAVNGVGTGALSTEVAETPQSPPSAPTGLTRKACEGQGGAALLDRLYRRDVVPCLPQHDGCHRPYALLVSTTSPSYKDTSTTRGVTYYYKVTGAQHLRGKPAVERSVGEGKLASQRSDSTGDLGGADSAQRRWNARRISDAVAAWPSFALIPSSASVVRNNE